MRASSGIGALAVAALVSGTASATEIFVGKSGLVIDVEFWGRLRIVSANPEGGNNDIITLGDPVRGTFRVHAGDAPPPLDSTGLSREEATYGDNRVGSAPTGAAFVTSRWLSPLPKSPTLPVGITPQVSPFAGSVPNDYVVIIDRAPFGASEPLWDWFQVSDRFSPNSPNDTIFDGESLTISITGPLDFIQGTGLDQEFELADLQETDGIQTFGFLRAKVGEAAVAFHQFVIDRIRVSPRVCKP